MPLSAPVWSVWVWVKFQCRIRRIPNYWTLQVTLLGEIPAGELRPSLQQGRGEDEPERGGAAVEDQEQLRAASWDLLALSYPADTSSVWEVGS